GFTRVFFEQFLEGSQLGCAWRTPGRAKRNEHHVATQFSGVIQSAIKIQQFESWLPARSALLAARRRDAGGRQDHYAECDQDKSMISQNQFHFSARLATTAACS